MKKLEIEIADERDARSWNEFVKISANSTPYHLWEYAESLLSTYNFRRFYLVAKENGEIAGVLPLIQVKSFFFGNKLISMPFCEYGGPLSKLSYIKKSLLKMSAKVANEVGADYVEIRNPPDNIFNIDGRYCKVQRYVTFKIDITRSKEILWLNLCKKTRNAVKKAMKNGVELKEAKLEDLKVYYTLYLRSQKRHGSPPNSSKLFHHFYRLLQPIGIMRTLLAEHQGRMIGGIITFQFNSIIYWWSNVTDPDNRWLNPTHLLLWNTLEWGREKGFKILDLGRTREFTSVYNFKKGWGGKEIILQDYVWFLNHHKKELPDPEQRKYRFLSRFWSLVPTVLAERIGPRIVSGIGL